MTSYHFEHGWIVCVLLDHGEVVGVVHRCGEEISDVARALTAMEQAIDAVGSLPPAEVLHTLAAVGAVHDDRHQSEIEQLRRAIETRDIIGQAKGMLMERFAIDASAAFKLLVKLSQESNCPVAQIARKLVAIDHPDSLSRPHVDRPG